MKKRLLGISCVLAMSVSLLTGCGNAIPDMTAQQEEVITQYAADILVQSKSGNTRLIDTAAETARRQEIAKKAAAVQAKIEAAKKEKEAAKESAQAKLDQTPVTNATGVTETAAAAETLSSVGDLSAFLSLNGLTVAYQGCELASSYTDQSEEDQQWSPSIDATAGKQLLIVKLAVSNPTTADVMADVVSQNPVFRLVANEQDGGTTLMTMLLSDFSLLQENIPAGATENYVLITQVSSDTKEINSLKLYAEKGSAAITVGLQ